MASPPTSSGSAEVVPDCGADVVRLANDPTVVPLLARFGLRLTITNRDADIPGSFWGADEAGLQQNSLYARADTPLHSILHEACHYICMTEQRRRQLHTNAGGDYDEENAVCYLSILLADQLPRLGRQRMLEDMDRWGYTFRLGSAQRWFDEDAAEVRQQLRQWQLIDEQGLPTYRLRC